MSVSAENPGVDKVEGELETWTVRLAMSLATLHVWGVDDKADLAVHQMMKAVVLADPTAESPSMRRGPLPRTGTGYSLTQGVVYGASNAMTLNFPCHVQEEPVVGHLWLSNGDFVADYLVFMVATSKQLMHESMNEVVCSACSILATLYAIQFPQIIMDGCHPTLRRIVDLWDHSIAVLRETSRVLLASITDLNLIAEELSEKKAENPLIGVAEMRAVQKLAADLVPMDQERLMKYQHEVRTHLCP